MQQEKVIEVRRVRAPSGRKLIAVDGPCGQKSIYGRDEAVWTALLMLAVVSTAYPTAEEFARVIDRARSGISADPLRPCRFWLIMMTGACTAASIDRNRFGGQP